MDDNEEVLKIVVDNREFEVIDEWISRWQLLIDIVEDMGKKDPIILSSLSLNQVTQWIELNRRISKNPSKYHILDLSSCWEVVRFMRPSTTDYLLHCNIDQKLEERDRRLLYEELGLYIRKRGIRMLYATKTDKKGLHDNLGLADDLAYGISVKKVNGYSILGELPFSSFDERIQKRILDADLNVITGIMHTTSYVSSSINHKNKLYTSFELPWYLIPWDDVVKFGYCHPRLYHNQKHSLYSVLDAIVRYSQTNRQANTNVKNVITRVCSNIITPNEIHDKGLMDCIGEYVRYIGDFEQSVNKIPGMMSSDPTYDDNVVQMVTLSQSNDGRLGVLVDEFSDLLAIYCKRLDSFAINMKKYKVEDGCYAKSRIEFCKKLIHGLFLNEPPSLCRMNSKKEDTTLDNAICHLVRCCWYFGNGKVPQTSEYINICNKIVSTLGSRFLTSFVGIIMAYIDTVTDGTLEEKMVLFVSQTVDIIDKSTKKNMQQWPVIPNCLAIPPPEQEDKIVTKSMKLEWKEQDQDYETWY